MGAAWDMVPSGEPRSALRFSDYILDFDACKLKRTSGETVALTRSEFALLRFLASRPGRVASREALLDAIANRQLAPFDRSVDVVVGRLRRKIEPEPKRPRIIVTVPGEGYRFDGLALPGAHPQPDGARANAANPDVSPASPSSRERRSEAFRRAPVSLVAAALSIALVLGLVGSRLHWREDEAVPAEPPKVLVEPFANLTGDGSIDHLGPALALEVAAYLGAFPGLEVLSPPSSAGASQGAMEAERTAGARYLVRGGVHRSGDGLRITATLYDARTGTAVWSQVFDPDQRARLKEDVSRRIYDAIAGFRGRIYADQERAAWGKASAALGEYDYFLRGLSAYTRFTLPDDLRARASLQEGQSRYPNSRLLRLMQAWTYLWPAMTRADRGSPADVEQAWRLAAEASSAGPLSPLEAWLAHWLMAFLYQWRDNDFPRSVREAREAVELAPYDADSRSELSWILANAGYGDEAIAWAQESLDHARNGPSRLTANLAWAYYVAGRNQEGIDALGEMSAEFPLLHAALLVRLGQVEKAKTLIEGHKNSGARDTIEEQDAVPLAEPAGAEYVAALRKAGLPER